MKIESSRQTFTVQTDRQTFAFLELLLEPQQLHSSLGIRENLRLLAVYYPKWVMRLYYDVDMKDPLLKDLCNIACEYDALDLCYVRCKSYFTS